MKTSNQATWHFDKTEQRRLKRDIVLKIAAECFNEKGITGTSLKDVSKKLNITDAALYYYVKNKGELVSLCYMRALDLGERSLDQAIEDGSTSLERLQLYIRYQLETVCGEEGPVAILSEVPSLKPEQQKIIRARSSQHTKRITQLIIDGNKEGSLASDDPAIACDAILGALNWTPKWYKPNSGMTGGQIAEVFIQTFTQGLLPR